MCPPLVVGVVVAVASMAAGAMQAIQKNKADKAAYKGKVQAQKVATEQSRADRDAAHQGNIREREAAERKYTENQVESTLEGEMLRGKALVQNSTTNVSSAVFDQFDRQTYMQMQENNTSNIWNLQANARNLTASSEGDWRKEEARIYKNRAGAPPANTLGMDLGIAALNATASGLSAYGAAKPA